MAIKASTARSTPPSTHQVFLPESFIFLSALNIFIIIGKVENQANERMYFTQTGDNVWRELFGDLYADWLVKKPFAVGWTRNLAGLDVSSTRVFFLIILLTSCNSGRSALLALLFW
jgi:hypothetical protein